MTYLAYSNSWRIFSKLPLYLLVFFLLINNVCAQVYPPDSSMSDVNYNPPASLPGYLQPFEEENFGNTVIRVSNLANFGGDNISLRHGYAKRQVWNSDGSLIALAGYQAKILDGNTYDLLGTATGFGTLGWSNTNPLRAFSQAQVVIGSEYRILIQTPMK